MDHLNFGDFSTSNNLVFDQSSYLHYEFISGFRSDNLSVSWLHTYNKGSSLYICTWCLASDLTSLVYLIEIWKYVTTRHLSGVMRKPDFAYAKTMAQISC